MSDKLIVMSLSVKPEMHVLLKTSAKKIGRSVSDLVRTLVEKYLPLIVNDGQDIPVILKVPSALRGDEEGLRKWLAIKTDAITKALTTKAS
jgi:hypothetical protein